MEIIRPEYHPAQDAAYGGSPLRPLLNTPTYDERNHWMVAVQPFRAGGYEATLRLVDLQEAADRSHRQQFMGPRTEQVERSQESIESARQRAKSMVRKRIKDMGGNRLCTLTARQSDALGYLSPDDWADAFAKFRRLMRKAGLLANYVAVLEPHKKGLERLAARRDAPLGGHGVSAAATTWDIPLHIHFVTRSDFKMPINLMRKCWQIACGRDGNVDVQWLKPGRGRDAIDKVAAYASKYISKGLEEFERFNKKRYWSAGDALLPKGRTWFKGQALHEIWQPLMDRLGLDGERCHELLMSRCVFMFPDGSGMWFNVRPSPAAAPPPF